MRQRESLTEAQERELEALDRALRGEPVDPDLDGLSQLVGDVRATAPEMSPGFAARLQEDVSAGFPSSREKRRGRSEGSGRRRRWPTTALLRPRVLLPVAGTLAAALIALTVVLGGSTESIQTFSGPSTAERGDPVAGVAADEGTGDAEASKAAPPAAESAARDSQSSGAAAPSAPGSIAPNAPQRDIERSATLVVQTPDDEFAAATDEVNAIVGRFRGIVASSQIGSSDSDGGEASFDLRIPTGQLDKALAALAKLGHVTQRNQSLTDITAPTSSAEERLSDARAERRGLRRSLARASSQKAIDGLKEKLRSVNARIGRLGSQLAGLRRRADLATVALTIRGDGEQGGAGDGGAWTPGDAASDALRVLEVLAGVALIALAILVPVGLLGAVVALTVRASRRRRREGALDPA